MNLFLNCLLIFIAKLINVALSSIRTIFLVKQRNHIASFLSFIEMLLWFIIAKKIFSPTGDNILIVLSYALGYSVGTYLGGIISKFFLKRNMMAIIITKKKEELTNKLKALNYGVSKMNMENGLTMLMVLFFSNDVTKFKNIVLTVDKSAFIIINESIFVENGYVI